MWPAGTSASGVWPCTHSRDSQVSLFPAQDYISGDFFQVQRCKLCSLVRTVPGIDRGNAERYYPHEYYSDAHRFIPPVERLLSRRRAYWATRIHRANGGRPGRVLDVGCGRGQLLDQLRRRGWEVLGTELTDDAASFARQTLHLDVRVGELLKLDLEQRSFDAVVLWHVLEHVPDPARLIREVGQLVTPGGLLVLSVPNFGSFEARLWRGRWFHLDVPRHLSHFTVGTLTALLAAEHFEPQRVLYFSPEYDYFSFIQSALNGLGLQQNLLYEVFRSRQAKVLAHAGAKSKRDMIANFALAPSLAALAFLLVPLAGLLRRGATMVVLARRL
jgi:2-polyprenyl-3-methyl-5-hydroxy-6-metoxy-1,4-benzoquinol methylase